MLTGRIIKGIGGFYYVKVDGVIYECRARGTFRKDKITPQVGDVVEIRISPEDNSGYVEKIFERKTDLLRPPVSNVDHAIIVFSIRTPDPNLWLLDRFLVLAEYNNLSTTICLNKIDLASEHNLEFINKAYEKAGYIVLNTSTKTGEGIDQVKEILKDRITVFAGPSGVGKSTLLNMVQPNLELKTGEISEKTKRGKHTTRHTELLELDTGGLVVDTPGFSSLDIDFINQEELQKFFKEIYDKSDECKFNGCKHDKEPKCAVKEAVENGDISESRYENYLKFLEELKSIRRY